MARTRPQAPMGHQGSDTNGHLGSGARARAPGGHLSYGGKSWHGLDPRHQWAPRVGHQWASGLGHQARTWATEANPNTDLTTSSNGHQGSRTNEHQGSSTSRAHELRRQILTLTRPQAPMGTKAREQRAPGLGHQAGT